ncbi:MAG: hypothetical protein LBU36_00795 [Clostridiales bacterium]|nr:hypothetical protein [Clostridiales bacterium]
MCEKKPRFSFGNSYFYGFILNRAGFRGRFGGNLIYGKNAGAACRTGRLSGEDIYMLELDLETGENSLYFSPIEDFDFSNGNGTAYGYIKVVDDLETADIDAIKQEVAEFQTLIYPPDTFQQSCH